MGLFMKNKANNLSNSSINKESITKEINNNLIGAYIQEGEEYKQTDDIPSSGYEFNEEKSYCKIGEDIQEGTILSYDINTQTLTVSPMTKEGMKCYLYFDEKASGSEYILASLNAPTNHTTDWTGEESYYYTGNPNNWVQFGTNSSGQSLYWRMIRINGDGSIRLIYNGTNTSQTGESTMIETSQAFNNSSNDNMYVGYMYGNTNASDYAGTHANTNSSTIKGVLDNWYSNYIENEQSNIHYEQYIDINAGFCGDRRVSSGTGVGTSSTVYQPFTRISNSNPSLSCNTNDIYTTIDSSTGNKALTYPIGLISADEAMFAGIPYRNSSGNSNNYLYTGQNYWTVSPYDFNSYARVFLVYSNGDFNDEWGLFGEAGVRPVINISADVQITGSGTTTNPFKVVGAD